MQRIKRKHGYLIYAISIVLFLSAVGIKYLCVLHQWNASGLDLFMVSFGLVVAGIGSGILITLDANKE
jgi:hypothetical protein